MSVRRWPVLTTTAVSCALLLAGPGPVSAASAATQGAEQVASDRIEVSPGQTYVVAATTRLRALTVATGGQVVAPPGTASP